MRLHTDGTIEGTPEEVAAYKREMHPVLVTEGRIKPPEHNYQILERPPLGLIPRHIREQQRLQEIKEAIERKKVSGVCAYPSEWREEADDLKRSIDAYYRKNDILPAN